MLSALMMRLEGCHHIKPNQQMFRKCPLKDGTKNGMLTPAKIQPTNWLLILRIKSLAIGQDVG
jgi:hypothetical protein